MNGVTVVLHLFITAIECPPLSLANGMITYAGDTTPGFEIGTGATHACDTGFALVGFVTRTCEDDDQADIVGLWSGSPPPTCERTALEHYLF